MKKLLSAIISVCLFSSLFTTALASDRTNPAPEDYGDPIFETTYYDEELDATIVERTYFVPDAITTFDNLSGRGWRKNEKEIRWNNSSANVTKYFVEAYFVWGNGKSTVSNARKGYDWLPAGYTVTRDEVVTGEGQYGFIFNHYSYATYYLSFSNNKSNLHKKLDVTIRVSESGNNI